MVVSAVSIVALSVYLIRKKPRSRLLCLSLAFVIGGGIGNMIDRVALGYVVDMIDFRLIHFAVFNVADSFVCVGAGMLMLYLILSMRREVLAGVRRRPRSRRVRRRKRIRMHLPRTRLLRTRQPRKGSDPIRPIPAPPPTVRRTAERRTHDGHPRYDPRYEPRGDPRSDP